MAKVVKPAVEANFEDTQVFIHKKFAGQFNLQLIQVFKECHSHIGPEKAT